ncbi:MAG: C39 family peptidase [Candidatus Sabulitectum sp.]|nr:C39 family peptidase [Candidatus Sabulitectum sp.]
MLLICILAALGISAGFHGNRQLSTDLTGSVLFLDSRMLSSSPGSGRTVLSTGEDLFWKECPAEAPQRIMSMEQGEIFFCEYFSGPFSNGTGLMVSVPGEILLLDLSGTVLSSLSTGEFPGSLCSDGENIWFISSRDGLMKRLAMPTGRIDVVDLPFTPVTVEYRNGLLLIGKAEGGYSISGEDGNHVFDIQDAFFGHFSRNNTIAFTRSSESYGCETISWETVSFDITTAEETVIPFQQESSDAQVAYQSDYDDPVTHFDVPYMHQKWDTPDWFNGSWSCGPTSCLMAVQYYNRLTPDSIWCSYPSGHWSQWGNYIPAEYTFLGHTYDIQGESPGGTWVPGAHGFICRSYQGAGWNEMIWWTSQHGLDSNWLGTTWSACTSELDSAWPVTASTTSPFTGGHILLFNGYYDNHSVVCNDSYGNQNLPGWGTLPNGKDVVYDWPGYNNGNTQLGISQLFSARSEPLAAPGTLIDDRNLGYRKLGPCEYWHEQETGYAGYSWWTYSTGAQPDTCSVEWLPELPSQAWYLVETYVPSSHATATGIYHVNTSSGWTTATVDQGNYSNQWAIVGSFSLSPSSAMVRMGDYTGTQGQYLSFDAVRFTEQTSIEDQNSASGSEDFSIMQNPVQTGSAIAFNLPEGFSGTLEIYDLTGRRTACTETWTIPGVLPAGVYHAVISFKNTDICQSIRFTVTD